MRRSLRCIPLIATAAFVWGAWHTATLRDDIPIPLPPAPSDVLAPTVTAASPPPPQYLSCCTDTACRPDPSAFDPPAVLKAPLSKKTLERRRSRDPTARTEKYTSDPGAVRVVAGVRFVRYGGPSACKHLWTLKYGKEWMGVDAGLERCAAQADCHAVGCVGATSVCTTFLATCRVPNAGEGEEAGQLFVAVDRTPHQTHLQRRLEEELDAMDVATLRDFSHLVPPRGASEPPPPADPAARLQEDWARLMRSVEYHNTTAEPTCVPLGRGARRDYGPSGARFQEWQRRRDGRDYTTSGAPRRPYDTPLGDYAKPFLLVRGPELWSMDYVHVDVVHRLVLWTPAKVGSTEFLKLYDRIQGRSGYWGPSHTWGIHARWDTDKVHYERIKLRLLSLEHANKLINSPAFTHVTFLRDPKERALSAYLMLTHGGAGVDAASDPKWRRFVAGIATRDYLDVPVKQLTEQRGTGPFADTHFRGQMVHFALFKYLRVMDFVAPFTPANVKTFMQMYGLWDRFGAAWQNGPDDPPHDFLQTGSKARHKTDAASKAAAYWPPALAALGDQAYALDYQLMCEMGFRPDGGPIDGRNVPEREVRCLCFDPDSVEGFDRQFFGCWPGPVV
eukprot:TRINITY_DN774_c3_g1_i1.p1 TRINITY_DN774_c3_g1~~TRINITY_DN774_c3_g1_i1.p1  ORF type:complete len:617 (+),score=115.60 TRINITY_DN774_c3_g1_i1:402-2252(+)